MYLDDCPLEKYIPIYLVVSGSVGLFYNLFGIVQSACCKRKPENEGAEEEQGAGSKFGSCLSSLLSCFMFAWFIAGKKNLPIIIMEYPPHVQLPYEYSLHLKIENLGILSILTCVYHHSGILHIGVKGTQFELKISNGIFSFSMFTMLN